MLLSHDRQTDSRKYIHHARRVLKNSESMWKKEAAYFDLPFAGAQLINHCTVLN